MERRLKYIYASKEFIAKILKSGKKTVYNGLPEDATIVNIVYRPEYDVFHIIVHSKTFRELAECELMERWKGISVVAR